MNENRPREKVPSRADSTEFAISPEIRWIVFDAVGTLIRPNPSVAVAYQMIGARHGSRVTADETGDRFRLAFEQSENDSFPGGPPKGAPWLTGHDIEVARWRWIVRQVLFDVNDLVKCFDELWDHFSRPASWSCFDDVKASLESLSAAGYRLAIASNFDSRLHSVCDGRVELNRIERRFVSSEIGFRKPAAGFFQSVIDTCGVPASQILMVGDDAEHDVAGPEASGMNAILIDRDSTLSNVRSIRTLEKLVPQ